VSDATVETETDVDGYFRVRLQPGHASLTSPWTTGTVELAGDYRGVHGAFTASVDVLVPDGAARFGVVSDVDDTILQTGVQRVWLMIRRTFTGSALTRSPFEGAADLYRDLAAGTNPVFYVSSSPWNLHAFLVAFLRHHDFPRGPVLLRDLLGSSRCTPTCPSCSSATPARGTPRSTRRRSATTPAGSAPSTSARSV